MKDYEDLRLKVRALTPEQLELHGVITKAKTSGYVCPFCGNGTGEEGTGLDLVEKGDTYLYNCFKCDAEGDIIRLLAKHYNLDDASQFHQVLDRAAVDFNLYVDDYKAKTSSANDSANDSADDVEEDFSMLILDAETKLDNFLKGKGGAYRALTAETLHNFHVGFHHDNFKTARLVIPYSKNHYLDRSLDTATAKKYQKIHHGKKGIFNYVELEKAEGEETYFCVEGEFDAMSIVQAGYKAFALGGSKINKDKQTAQLKAVAKKPRVIVMLDNDETGKKSAPKVAKKLTALGYVAVLAFLPERITLADGTVKSVKDANDILQLDAEQLPKILQNIMSSKADDFEAEERQKSFDEERELPNLTSKQVFPNCPVDVVIPDGFFVRREGIYRDYVTKPAEIFSYTPVFVTQIYRSQEYTEKKIDITVYDGRLDIWHNHTLEIGDLADTRTFNKKVVKLDICLDASGASNLIKFLMAMMNDARNYGRIGEKRFFTQTGWLQEDCKKYILPTSLEGETPVMKGDFDYARAFATKGDKEKSRQLMKMIAKASPSARIVLGAVHAGPLLMPFGAPNPQVHLAPKTGSGKTALNIACMSSWGNVTELKQTFSNTQNHILALPTRWQHGVTWIEELQSFNDFGNGTTIKTQIYNFEYGKTRGRLDKEAEFKAQETFHAVRLTTGEHPITNYTSEQGAKYRVLELEDSNVLPTELATKIHEMFSSPRKQTYGHFGRDFVNYISQDGVLDRLEETYHRTIDRIKIISARHNGYHATDAHSLTPEQIGMSDRHIMMLALFQTALKGFAKVAFAGDYRTLQEVNDLLNKDLIYYVNEFSLQKISTNADRALAEIIESQTTMGDRYHKQTVDGKIIPCTRTPALGIKLNDGSTALFPRQLDKFLAEIGFKERRTIIAELHDKGVFIEGASEVHRYQKAVLINDGVNEPTYQYMFVLRADVEGWLEKQQLERIMEFEAQSAA